MRTMTVREEKSGRKMTVNAKRTFQQASGQWIAEVDGSEFRQACAILCKGIEGCSCDKLHVQTIIDDDGKEYKVQVT